jgi:secondary thiamine-phosphate synthase enzyme
VVVRGPQGMFIETEPFGPEPEHTPQLMSALIHKGIHQNWQLLRQGRPTPRSSISPKAMTTQQTSVQQTEWFQKTLELPPFSRGSHVITRNITDAVPELALIEIGMFNVFIQHTSASLTINENASPDVPLDLTTSINKIVPEGPFYRHDDEGADDMPAHVKCSLLGASLSIPISSGKLAFGIWQGIYLNEHRDRGGSRTLVLTIQGVKRSDGRAYR